MSNLLLLMVAVKTRDIEMKSTSITFSSLDSMFSMTAGTTVTTHNPCGVGESTPTTLGLLLLAGFLDTAAEVVNAVVSLLHHILLSNLELRKNYNTLAHG